MEDDQNPLACSPIKLNYSNQGISNINVLPSLGLLKGSHYVKIAPNGCGKNRRHNSASFVV